MSYLPGRVCWRHIGPTCPCRLGPSLALAPLDADGVPPSRLKVWIVFGVLLAFALLLLHREANR